MSEPPPVSPASIGSDDAVLIDWLRQRDVACPLCGYNLRALREPRCPECGQALRLSVSLVEPYLRAWLTLLIITCLAGGPGLFCWFAAFLDSGFMRRAPVYGYLTVYSLMCASLLMPAVVFTRRRFQKLSRLAQWSLSGIALLWFLAVFGCVLYAINH